MICVSIGRGRHKELMAERAHLVERGAQLVELRLDYLRSEVDIRRLLDNRPCPVVITCRRQSDGGRWSGTEDKRRTLLRAAIVSGADYIDLEEDVAKSIPRYGKTKRIISHHDFQKTPDNLEAIHARLSALDPDIVKIATTANSPADNLRMLMLVKSASRPTVGLCMGDLGTPTRILAGKFGCPFTFATFHHERALAPGQLSFDEMKDVYHYDQISPETEVYGVVGDPIGHSLSPLVHNTAFRHHGLNKVYVPFRVPRGDFEAFLNQAPQLGVKGLSVTIPHKEAAFLALSSMDVPTKAIKACNTILFQGHERIGRNTDYAAASEAILAVAGTIRGKRALVLGAGGAAHAIAHAIKDLSAEVLITNRTKDRAEALATALKCNIVEWSARHTINADILVNCTPVGMHPNVDESPYEKTYFRPGTLVFDTIYNPETTMLIKEAQNRDCRTVTGVDMFVRQAGMQFKLFTGLAAPLDFMRQTLKRATGAVKE